jgi:rhamnose transport system permease protein
VPVVRLKTGLFVLSGVVAALAGIILTSRLSSARADAGQGMTLAVVTAVLLGGVNIFGGSGTIPGVALAIFTLAVLQNALRLADVSTELQSISVGLLLIVSVVVPNAAGRLTRLRWQSGAESNPSRGARERVPPIHLLDTGRDRQ